MKQRSKMSLGNVIALCPEIKMCVSALITSWISWFFMDGDYKYGGTQTTL